MDVLKLPVPEYKTNQTIPLKRGNTTPEKRRLYYFGVKHVKHSNGTHTAESSLRLITK